MSSSAYGSRQFKPELYPNYYTRRLDGRFCERYHASRFFGTVSKVVSIVMTLGDLHSRELLASMQISLWAISDSNGGPAGYEPAALDQLS